MPYKDVEKKAEYMKEYNKTYYQDNKSKRKKVIRSDEYYEKQKEYRASPHGKKVRTFNSWKSQGIIGDYEKIYERRMNTQSCDCCNCEFKSPNDKHTDHNHKITDTDNFRNILCLRCNTLRNFIDNDYQLVMKMLTF